MRLFYELEEADEFAAGRELLIRRCGVWAGARGLAVDGALLGAALSYRHGTVDGRLGFWTPEHVRTFLLSRVPGLAVAADPAPDTLRCLLGYLSAHGLLDPRGAALEQNLAAIADAEPEFEKALLCESIDVGVEGDERLPSHPPISLPDEAVLVRAAGMPLARWQDAFESLSGFDDVLDTLYGTPDPVSIERGALDALVHVGAVEVTGSLARLTDLGSWGVRTRLLAAGREAGLVGELARVPAAALLNVVADHYTPETARSEIGGWLAGHDGDVDALLAAVRDCPFRNRTAALLDVLTTALPDGPLLLRQLRADSVLAPVALSQLVDEGVLELEDVTESEGVAAMAEGFLRLLELAGVERTRELIIEQSGGDVARLLTAILESGHPDAVAMADFRVHVADHLRPPVRSHRHHRIVSHHDRPTPTRPHHRRPRRR